MRQWPEHSVQSYLTKLPTYKLEILLDIKDLPQSNFVLHPEDYALIEMVLRNRPDSRFWQERE